MATILCIGMVCEDTIVKVKEFPIEDSDQRTLDQWKTRGGNASNMSTVLASFGLKVEIFASLANDTINHFIESDLAKHKIGFSHCPKHQDSKSPNSYIILNANSGTRTILHTNLGLPELTFQQFQQKVLPDVQNFSWMHFEGRPNIADIESMLKSIQKLGKIRPKVSLEMEKLGRNYDSLLEFVDLIFISKEYARSKGHKNKTETVAGFARDMKIMVVCAWGEEGASGRDESGTVFDVPVYEPPKVVDTIGAGDTFNASVVGALNLGKDLEEAVKIGCKVAGTKVGQFGFEGLKNVFLQL